MRTCPQARDLFGPHWDDEITRGERDWLESHLAGCADCLAAYDRYARTLEAVATLPRPEMAADLAERSLDEAKRRQRAPDVLPVPMRPRWQPLAVAAGLALVTMTSVLLWRSPNPGTSPSALESPVAEPRLVAVDEPNGASLSRPADALSRTTSADLAADSLFDHAEDVEFILDPILLRRGRAHTGRLPEGIQGEQAVISF